MSRTTFLILCILISLCGFVYPQTNPQSAAQVIESGKFRFYETKQLRGEEDYTISRSTDGELFHQAKTSMPFSFEETKPLVNATLRTKVDSTPVAFEIKGPTMLEIEENTSVQVRDQTVNVQDRGRNETLKPPGV
jgi:hypothetical protein